MYLIVSRLAESTKRKRSQFVLPYIILKRIPIQLNRMDRLVGLTDTDCLVNLRMDRNAFGKLCVMFRELGYLRDKRFVCIKEQVAIFLGVLAHHKKNRLCGFDFMRSGHTVSGFVHKVLRAVIKMHSRFMAKPEPITDNCVDYRWKWFKVRFNHFYETTFHQYIQQFCPKGLDNYLQGCLGALNGTYINVLVSNADTRYRTRKGQISANTLAACDRHMRFTYVLPGWEGSAGDVRILRDAVNRPHGLRVPLDMAVRILFHSLLIFVLLTYLTE